MRALEEIERERRLVLSQIQTRADTPFPLSFDSMLADLYAGHPYAWPSVGTFVYVPGSGLEVSSTALVAPAASPRRQ